MVLTARVGPRHPRNFSFLFSSASVASKNFSSSSIARAGSRRTSCSSPSKGERSGTAKIRSFLVRDLQDFEHADRFAAKHQTRVGRRVMDHENIERIAVFGLG